MNIVCCTDNVYVPHLATMLQSLRDHNVGLDISIHLLLDEVSDLNIQMLFRHCERLFGGLSIIQVPSKRLKGLPVTHHVSLATYYRLLIPELMPYGCDRALFLDSDMIINTGIDDLYQTNIGNRPIAAVRSPDIGSSKARLGFNADEHYFNAGMLLMDLSLMRSDNLVEFAVHIINSSPERIRWWDQDVLNLYYRNNWTLLPDCFNSLPCWWTGDQQGESGSEFNPSKRNHEKPTIIHFTGPGACKPWHYRCTHPWAYLYHHYRKQTPWRSYHLEGRESLHTFGTRQIRRIGSKIKRLASKDKSI